MSKQEEETEATNRSRGREVRDAFDASIAEQRRSLERWRKVLRALIEFAESDQGKHLFSRDVIEEAKQIAAESAEDGKDAL